MGDKSANDAAGAEPALGADPGIGPATDEELLWPEVPAPRGNRVQSVERAVMLLRAVAAATSPQQNTVAAIAARCGLNRATAWRLLTTLEHDELLSYDRVTGHWTTGAGLTELAGLTSVGGLVRNARTVLENLSRRTGETAALAVFTSGDLHYVDEVAPPSAVAARWKERSVPLHATSAGKALLAHASDELLDSTLRLPLEQFTASTITVPDELRAELARTRIAGYAICRGEYEESVYGVAAAFLDPAGRPRAVLTVWGPRHRMYEDRIPALGALVSESVQQLARR